MSPASRALYLQKLHSKTQLGMFQKLGYGLYVKSIAKSLVHQNSWRVSSALSSRLPINRESIVHQHFPLDESLVSSLFSFSLSVTGATLIIDDSFLFIARALRGHRPLFCPHVLTSVTLRPVGELRAWRGPRVLLEEFQPIRTLVCDPSRVPFRSDRDFGAHSGPARTARTGSAL